MKIESNQNNKMKIAIAGQICSGKTTLAKMIIDKYPELRFKKTSFASQLKKIVNELFSPDKKDRELLIRVGSSMREINPNVWVNYVLSKTESTNSSWIIDDLRFENEFIHLKKTKSWKFIKIEISDELRKKRIRALYPDDYEIHFKYLEQEKKELDKINSSEFDEIFHVQEETHELQLKEIENQLEKFMENNFIEKPDYTNTDEERDPIFFLGFVMWGLFLSKILYNYLIN